MEPPKTLELLAQQDLRGAWGHRGRWVSLAMLVRRGIRAFQVTPPTLAQQAPLVCKELLVLRYRQEQRALQVTQALRVIQDSLAQRAPQGQRALRGQRGHQE
jgi:hypothetical protein